VLRERSPCKGRLCLALFLEGMLRILKRSCRSRGRNKLLTLSTKSERERKCIPLEKRSYIALGRKWRGSMGGGEGTFISGSLKKTVPPWELSIPARENTLTRRNGVTRGRSLRRSSEKERTSPLEEGKWKNSLCSADQDRPGMSVLLQRKLLPAKELLP